MNREEIILAWKDPEAERTETPSPLGEPDLVDAFGGLVPITTHSGPYISICSSCGSFSYGCC